MPINIYHTTVLLRRPRLLLLAGLGTVGLLCVIYYYCFWNDKVVSNAAKLNYSTTQLPTQLLNYPKMSAIVHQSWKSSQLPTNRSKRWRESWKNCFPDWEMKLWTDDDNLALVRDHYTWFLPFYLRFKNPVEKADIARYFYMFHHGGVYTDLDNVCLKNFAHLINTSGLIFSGMDGGNKFNDPVLGTYIQNSFMASRPGHPFWMSLINRVMRYQQNAKIGLRAEYQTGPYVLMDELKEFLKSEGNRRDVTIYPGNLFNPFSWATNRVPACKDLGVMTEDDEMSCRAAFRDAYVIQFHAQSWLAGHL